MSLIVKLSTNCSPFDGTFTILSRVNETFVGQTSPPPYTTSQLEVPDADATDAVVSITVAAVKSADVRFNDFMNEKIELSTEPVN